MTGLTSEFTFLNHLDEKRRRRILVVAHPFMKDIHDVKDSIQADQVRQSQRTNRVIHSKLHDSINSLGLGDAFLQGKNRLEVEKLPKKSLTSYLKTNFLSISIMEGFLQKLEMIGKKVGQKTKPE